MAELRREHPGKAVELWAEDEARLGLEPIARRVWAVRGRIIDSTIVRAHRHSADALKE